MATEMGVVDKTDNANDPRFRWVEMADGWQIPEGPARFLDWMLTFPRSPATQEEFAKELGVDSRTLRRWKKDIRFMKEWDARATELNISPERVQSVVDNLHLIASTRQDAAGVKAAALYLEHAGKYTPKRVVQVDDQSLEKLSYEDLISIAQLDGMDVSR